MKKWGQLIGGLIVAASIQQTDIALFVIGFVVIGLYTFKITLEPEK